MRQDRNQIKRKNILIVGDVMLDQYFCGRVSRISPEAPVPVLCKDTEKAVPGGAANVAVNIAAGGQNAFLMSVIGEDGAGDTLARLLGQRGVDVSALVRYNRKTTVKTRFLADSHQQLLRMDAEDTEDMPTEITDRLLAKLADILDRIDLVAVSDYRKGLMTRAFTRSLIQTANRMQKKVLIDVKDPDVSKYEGACLLKPNLAELRQLTNMAADTDSEIEEASRQLMRKTGCTYVLTTCGARGMVLVGEDLLYKVKPAGKEVFDVTGAGDTVLAYLAACLANGLDIRDAVLAADYAAGIQVAKAGTASVSLQEVCRAVKPGLLQPESDEGSKILSGREIDNFRQQYEGRKIVFTNGCFDILHTGHVRCLREAAGLGDVLVVGLNSDASARRLKGAGRPVNSEADRAEMLCALGCVDYVAVFGEDTPERLIAKIQPDVLVKGGDYAGLDIAGSEIVRARGGTVKILPFTEGKSTTGMIHNIITNR